MAFEYGMQRNQQGSTKTPGSCSKNNSFCEQWETFLLLLIQGVNGLETAQGLLSDLPLTYEQAVWLPPSMVLSVHAEQRASQPRQVTKATDPHQKYSSPFSGHQNSYYMNTQLPKDGTHSRGVAYLGTY